jgi:hypothetical protein
MLWGLPTRKSAIQPTWKFNLRILTICEFHFRGSLPLKKLLMEMVDA